MIEEKCTRTFVVTWMVRQRFGIRVARNVSQKFGVILKEFPDFSISGITVFTEQ